MDPELKVALERWAQKTSQERPVKPRLREYVWIALTLVFFAAWINKDEIRHELVVAEASAKACERHREAAEQHMRTIAQLGENGGTILIGNKPAAICKRKTS